MRKRRVSLAVWVLAAGAIVASPAAAQIQTGSLLVRALDEQGAVVPGVTVTISSVVMPRALEGVTDASGIFQAPGLGVGRYTVKTSLQGFQTIIRDGVDRDAGADDQRRSDDEGQHARGGSDRQG